MKITGNQLLGGTDKTIEFYNSAAIVKDGPNMNGIIKLSDLAINYDSFFVSNMTLQSGGTFIPVLYGFLGEEITFILIKVNYGGDIGSPMSCVNEEKILNYYFQDEPLIERTMGEIMVLSGSADKRIPQIYLSNPGSYDVSVQIMVANVNENIIINGTSAPSSTISGLAFNDVITDQVFGLNCTGATQYEVLDFEGNVQMVIPYNKIDIVKIDGSTITIVTKSDDDVKLSFVSNKQAQQALSRMTYVREDTANRYLTKIFVGLDNTSPTITYNVLGNPTVMTGSNITKTDIRTRYIYDVKDYDDANILRDGIINNNDVTVDIMKVTSGEIVDTITTDGYYTLIFSIGDLAGNETNESKSLLVDANAPVITFLDDVDTGFTMSLSTSTQTPGTGTTTDIILNSVNFVWDEVDGQISNGSIVVTINSGALTEITSTGTYTIGYSVSDTAGNTSNVTKTLYMIV